MGGGTPRRRRRARTSPADSPGRGDEALPARRASAGGGGRRQRGGQHSPPAHDLPGGARYHGAWEQGAPHGHGTLVDGKGNRFEGRFERGQRVLGQTFFFNGDSHAGPYVDGRRHGPGHTYAFRNGDRYDGEFTRGRMTGTGRFRWADGTVYQGELVDGRPHGQGTKLERSGDKYSGEWKEGKAHGWGLKFYACGDCHEGSYEANLRHGYGRYRWQNGDTYEGFYRLGKACGRGRKVTQRCILEGEFEDDRLHGTGRKTFRKSETVYEGRMKQGEFEGTGRLRWSDGHELRGDFVANALVAGHKSFGPGGHYVGQWRNGLAHGLGVRVFDNGDVYRGQFAFDFRHGAGSYSWHASRALYRGAWAAGREHGLGTLLLSGAIMHRATYVAGQRHGHALLSVPHGEAVRHACQVWRDGALAQHTVVARGEDLDRYRPPPEVDTVDKFLEYFLRSGPMPPDSPAVTDLTVALPSPDPVDPEPWNASVADSAIRVPPELPPSLLASLAAT